MMTKTPSRGRVGLALVATAATALLLASCAGGESTPTDEPAAGEGVPYGASMEQYHEAFVDVDPVTLRIQGGGTEGSLTQAGMEAWTAAVEEWSDGKITFEWGYGNSFVPSAVEWASGLADGRLDAGLFLPYNTPDVFPQLSQLNNATFMDGNRPTGTLISSAWITEIIYSLEEYQAEAEANGIHLLLLQPSANYGGIFCTEKRTTLDELRGATVSAAGLRAEQLSSLGMAPQSVAFTELYEALERGVLNCATTTTTGLDAVGASTLVPHAVMDPEVSLVGFTNFFAVSKDRWDELPLVAQQLMFDRLDAMLETEPVAQAQRSIGWLEQIEGAGGGIYPLGDDAREQLRETNDGLLAAIGESGADVDAFVDSQQRWQDVINDQLYPDVTDSLQEFLGSGGFDNVDLEPFINAFFEEILLPNRPS